VARQLLPLQDDGFQAGVHQALGRRGRGQAGTDDDCVNGSHQGMILFIKSYHPPNRRGVPPDGH
jgi:hypothetical protein